MDFLTIGNITKDLIAGGYAVGGTVTYASVTALRLGLHPGVVTRMGSDIVLPEIYKDVELYALPSAHTLTFENIYTEDGRTQIVHAVADPIGVEDIPRHLHENNPPIVLLGPLARELEPRVAGLFPDALLGIVPQGWMRYWDENGRVYHKPLSCSDDVLRLADVLVMSTEDIGHDLTVAQCYAEAVKVLVLTRGMHGCDVYHNGRITHVRTRRALEIDPTGAGDTFTAAFLIRYAETRDPIEAARFANVAASFAVEGVSYSATPTRQQVEAYLAEHGWRM